MSTWRTTWQLVRFTPWLYLGSLLLQTVRLGIMVVPGLIVQRLFDILERETQFGWAFWGLIALLLAVALARVTALLSGIFVEQTAYFISAALLRSNAFARLLARPELEGELRAVARRGLFDDGQESVVRRHHAFRRVRVWHLGGIGADVEQPRRDAADPPAG